MPSASVASPASIGTSSQSATKGKAGRPRIPGAPKNPPASKAASSARHPGIENRFVDEHGAAIFLDLSVGTLRADRRNARRIPFIRIGPKTIRYDLHKIAALIEQNGGL